MNKSINIRDETSIAKLLLEGRKKCGMTLREVEKATGISNAQISLLESGTSTNPSVGNLFKLIKLYGLQVEDFIKAFETHSVDNL